MARCALVVSVLFVMWAVAGADEFQNNVVGLHVVVLAGNSTDKEDSFLHSACRFQYPSVQVLRNWCPTGRCEEDLRLEDHLKHLPEDDLVIVANVREEFVYLVASYEDARKQLTGKHNSLIVADASLLSADVESQKQAQPQEEKHAGGEEEEGKPPNEYKDGDDVQQSHDGKHGVENPEEMAADLSVPDETTNKAEVTSKIRHKENEKIEKMDTMNTIEVSDKFGNKGDRIDRKVGIEDEADIASQRGVEDKLTRAEADSSGGDQRKTNSDLIRAALTGGVLMGRVWSLVEAVQGQPEGGSLQVVPDTAAHYVLYGQRHQGNLVMGYPLRAEFTHEMSEGEATGGPTTAPLLVYGVQEKLDFYNVIEAMGEGRGACPYYSHSSDATTTQGEEQPRVLVSILLGGAWAPFLEEVLRSLATQDYPKGKMDVWILAKTGQQESEITQFTERYRDQYSSMEVTRDQALDAHLARSKCRAVGCSFLVLMEPQALLEDPATLSSLVASGRPVVGPLLKQRRKQGDTNFECGDSLDSQWNELIVNRKFRATLRVQKVKTFTVVTSGALEDYFAGKTQHFIDTSVHPGMLLDPRGYKAGKKHPDLWGIAHNKPTWAARYLHPDIFKIINKKMEPEQVGPYLYYVPFFTERFCREMIEEMEHFGQWFNKDEDDRDEAHTYTSVNINLSQIDYFDEYHKIINSVKMELLSALYGYRSLGITLLLFVLKYSSNSHYNTFKYHLDGATYTFNLALNNDFTGGGLEYKLGNPYFGQEREFLVPHNRTGWAVVQPNRPMHMHHGVPLTSGVRYALIAITATNDEGCKGGPSTVME
nr:multifunctional procollagen lysine hydroxylase and glycosyltransferase LH3-like [Procambarus clarkii]